MEELSLIIAIQNGDSEKFSYVIDKYHNELFKYVYNLIGDYQRTEDLIQEIFFKIYQKIKKYNPDLASFRTWIYRITTNHTYSYIKSKSYRQAKNNIEYNDLVFQDKTNPQDKLLKEEKINLILKVIEDLLKPKHYAIMSMHFFSYLTVKENSETLNIPQKTIYKAIKTSIEKIRKEVGVDEI